MIAEHLTITPRSAMNATSTMPKSYSEAVGFFDLDVCAYVNGEAKPDDLLAALYEAMKKFNTPKTQAIIIGDIPEGDQETDVAEIVDRCVRAHDGEAIRLVAVFQAEAIDDAVGSGRIVIIPDHLLTRKEHTGDREIGELLAAAMSKGLKVIVLHRNNDA